MNLMNALFKQLKLFNKIKGDTETKSISRDSDFKQVLTTVANNDFSNIVSDRDFKQIYLRDSLYTDLLTTFISQYSSRNEKKEENKWHFFWITVISFFLFIVFIAISLIILSAKLPSSQLVSALPAYITAIVGGISVIIVIPTSISKYLFNPDEDKAMLKMVQRMQDYDIKKVTDLKDRRG